MNKNVIIGVAIVVLLVGGLLVYSLGRQPQTKPRTGSSETSSPPPYLVGRPQLSIPEPSQPSRTRVVEMTVPAYGETWMLGKVHTVRWSSPAGRSGGIVLLDAASKKTVGWVTPSLLPNQVQYNWNTTSVTLSRTSPLRKDITSGNYIIRVVFDGLNQPLDSLPLPIIATGEENIVTREVTIRNYIFSPSFLTVKRGQQVVVENEDATSYALQMNGAPLLKLPQWNSYVFDAAKYSPGRYQIKLKEQPETLTVVVE